MYALFKMDHSRAEVPHLCPLSHRGVGYRDERRVPNLTWESETLWTFSKKGPNERGLGDRRSLGREVRGPAMHAGKQTEAMMGLGHSSEGSEDCSRWSSSGRGHL